jgi:molecular chaperone GrpE
LLHGQFVLGRALVDRLDDWIALLHNLHLLVEEMMENEKPSIAEIKENSLVELLKKAKERDEFYDLAARTQAEFVNYQKRNTKERENEKKYFKGALALDMLPVLDNLDRALQSIPGDNELSKGITMVRTQFLGALKKHGIEPIDTTGVFDPNLHQAVMQMEVADIDSNVIVQVLEQGFVHHDRVLRPSKVVVSK